MKKLNSWMQSAILFSGLLLTSCYSGGEVGIEDNPVSPTTKDDKKADVDEFYKVKAEAGDPAVVAALKSIPNVTDIKPFMTEEAGLAYYFNYKNYISHENPSLGTYKQQVVLVYSKAEDPVILHTEGYTLSGVQSGQGNKNRLDEMRFPTFLYTLSKDYADDNDKFNVNCVAVEYRYHGFSLPEGNTDKFTYLNAKEHSADLHAIVTDLKKYLFNKDNKWLSTGVSKSGMATYQYAYYYPNDVDAYFPFVAPLPLQYHDMRIGTYMIKSSVKDKLADLKRVFQKLASDEAIMAATTDSILKRENETSKFSDYEGDDRDTVIFNTIATCMYKLFGKQSYGDYDTWTALIPSENASPATYADFFMIDEDDDRIIRKTSGTRAALVKRKDPYEVQVPVDLGNLAHDYEWFKEDGLSLINGKVKKLIEDNETENKKSKAIDLQVKIKDWLTTTNCKMMFIYGEDDPWTGAAIDDPTNPNVQKVIVPHGTHNDYINKWNIYQGAQAVADKVNAAAKQALGIQ